jgi:Fe-S cluster biogenesis protein NfuA
MPWTLNKNGVTPRVTLTTAEQLKLNTFMNAVRAGQAPNVAASSWDSNYKKLQGTADQYEIRLSGGCRATFTVNTTTQVVTMLQVGGHT